MRPEILAPAGDTNAFLAALAAGCDAIYLGLKHFSARMEAENFPLSELSRLTDLAHSKSVRVYTAMNTLVKEGEAEQAFHLICRLEEQVHCDGLIVQDLCYPEIARQAGFSGKLFLSTLASVTHPEMLEDLPSLGFSRVILPRELSFDEIVQMDTACPDNLSLELFVHGALCYCVSGRCYWSSYMGGKSGLRGRCVQPCRREYSQLLGQKQRKAQYFSCQDLSLADYASSLLKRSHVTSWKIEGRKKGPHYVYHCVRAYRLVRDALLEDSQTVRDQALQEASDLLAMALGRSTTRARFIAAKALVPTDPGGRTSSGYCVGTSNLDASGAYLTAKIDLFADDFLRVGQEGDAWHETVRLKKNVAAGRRFSLPLLRKNLPPKNTPIFLIDRRDPALRECLASLHKELSAYSGRPSRPVTQKLTPPRPCSAKRRPDIAVLSTVPFGKENRAQGRRMLGLWLGRRSAAVSKTVARRVSFWLPPVVWPNESERIARLVRDLWRSGCRHFVANAPWQRAFFPKELPEGADLVAGPFCNLGNALAIDCVARLGFTAAFVSPELNAETILSLPARSPLPLGFVLEGFWPVGISRFGLLGVRANLSLKSPKGETFWLREYGQNVWIYPAWPLTLQDKEAELRAAGYSFFASLAENRPESLAATARPGLFNWEQPLL
ncbi:MAG: U32 family peptidase [Desulfovibrionaceae bacterium]|nr:U32 family peptidase [Desulfovibrionaceae bacterium]